MIEGSLYQFLSGIPAITAVVGDRIHPNHLADDTLPGLTYMLVSQPYDTVLQGSAGLARGRIQFDCWSHDLSECVTVIEAIRLNLQGYRGTLGNLAVISSILESERDLSEAPKDGSNRWLYRKSADYILRYRVGIPIFVSAHGGVTAGGLSS